MALYDPHATARYYVPRPRPEEVRPTAVEPPAMGSLRTRFTTAVAGIVFLGGLAIASGVSLLTSSHAHEWPGTVLVVSLVLLVAAVAEAAYVVHRAKRELYR